MNLFAQQEVARQYTYRLLSLLLAAVVAVIALTDLLVTLGLALIFDKNDLSWSFHLILDGTMLILMSLFTLQRLFQLRGGGDAIATMVGARQINRSTGSLEERRLLNVVDEMSIAAGVSVPSVWVMDKEPGINAFAAGYSPNQATIVVTGGMITRLSRDELQGVIGHEFSHILNGDIRLNSRLIGILSGIVMLGRAGLVLAGLVAAIPAALYGAINFIGFKVNNFIDRMGWRIIFFLPLLPVLFVLPAGLLFIMVMVDEMRVKPLVILGVLIFAAGYIGVFFGRIIRAAVSRQREFLADACSVQFTRNPDGLVGALEKIRCCDVTVMNSSYADEMSHMFFSLAISPIIFKNWFATHPTIDERLERITGHKPDAQNTPQNVAPSDQTGSAPEAAISNFGAATPQHVEQAASLLAAMPDTLRQSLGTPEGARAAVYAYLISREAAIRTIQTRALMEAGDGDMAAGNDDLFKTLSELGPAARLAVLSLATPALRQMDQVARDIFLIAVKKLVGADHKVTLDEFVIRTILGRQLSVKAMRPDRVRYKDIKSVTADAQLLLASVALAGNPGLAAQKSAFERGTARLGLVIEMPAHPKFSADALGEALNRLRQLAPLKKPDLISACVDTALADGMLRVEEIELLRTIGMSIDCPLPPMLESNPLRGS